MEIVKRYHEFDGLWKHILNDMWKSIKATSLPKDGQTRKYIADVDYQGEPFHIEVVFLYTNDYLIIKDSDIKKVKEVWHFKGIN